MSSTYPTSPAVDRRDDEDGGGVLDLPGQPSASRVLARAVATGEIGHAIALVGPTGVGQDEAARGLVAALACPVRPGGCGRCPDCTRALRGLHPWLVEFAPTGRVHRVVEVREQWLPAAAMTGVAGGWKVLRVREADRMNEASANAFLKVLEEPPARTLWLLDVADPDELPDTILSRCRVVRFRPWDRAALAARVADVVVDPGERRLLTGLAQGSPRRLDVLVAGRGRGPAAHVAHREIPRRLRDDGPGHAVLAARAVDAEVRAVTEVMRAESAARLDELDELYGGAPPKGVRAAAEAAAARRERETRAAVVAQALDDLALWLRDVLAVRGGADPSAAVHHDDPDGLRADAAAMAPEVLLGMLDLVVDTRERLDLNVGVQLALEALLLDCSALQMRGST